MSDIKQIQVGGVTYDISDESVRNNLGSDYYTKADIDSKGFLTTHQDVSSFALKSEIPDTTGFITEFTENDPTVPSYVKGITQDEINSWNLAAGNIFSGSYNDLTDKPSLLKGDKGDNYVITEADYSAIATLVINQLTDAEEVSY